MPVAPIPPPVARPEASAANESGLERQQNALSSDDNNERRRGSGGGNMEGGLHSLNSASSGTNMSMINNANLIGISTADASTSSSQIQSQNFSLKSLGGGPLKLREKVQRNSAYPY